MLSVYDYGVVLFYFLFLVSIGVVTRKFINNTSDYFRGGGRMLWWMTGSSAFMVQFSAWTFTGAASEAYLNGPIIMMIFLGNALGFGANYLFFAAKFRQMRVVTAMQAVRQRYGKSGEQFFTWLQIPIQTLQAGIWLMGLSVFISSVFGLPLHLTILGAGFIVLFNSTIGGSWAVVSSDFMQVLILMMIAIVTAVFSLNAVGGIGNMIQEFPADSLLGSNYNYPVVIFLWGVVMLVNQFFKTNHMIDASRYLNAKNSSHARKAALLSATLFVVGPILWFIPPMAAKILYPDLGVMFPSLKNPSEAAYVAIALNTLPHGMIGLLLAGMFAATISSMDSGLNRNAGIFVKNIYLSLLRPDANEREQMIVAKIATLFFGSIIIVTALYYSTLKGVGLFDLMISIGALLGLPVAVPLVLGMLVKRTPCWSGWTTTCVGLLCSALLKYHFDAAWFADTFALDFTSRDARYWSQAITVVVNTTIPTLWFFGTTFFYREPNEARQAELSVFWKNQATPIVDDDVQTSCDRSQFKVLGGLALVYGCFIVLLAIIPNPLYGRLTFLLLGAAMLSIGYLLYRSAKQSKTSSGVEHDASNRVSKKPSSLP